MATKKYVTPTSTNRRVHRGGRGASVRAGC